jgi:hypothetical protein
MAPVKSLSVTISRRDLPGAPAPDNPSAVVRLRREHDLSLTTAMAGPGAS